VKLTQTGGFAGVSRIIEVSSDGNVAVEDQRASSSRTRELSAEALAQLDGLVRSSGGTPGTDYPSVCADCFIYDLQVVSTKATYRVHTDDASIAGSGAEPLIVFLRQLCQHVLTEPP
jgi:hypothetical protein